MSPRNLKKTITDLLASSHLLSVSQILTALESEGKHYNKTSVYRALEQLHDEGSICRHYLSSNEASYELSADHHTHLVCQSCGLVQSVECSYTEPDNLVGFKPDHHHVTIVGWCQKCAQK